MLPTRMSPITTDADHPGQESFDGLVGRDRRGDVAPPEPRPGQVAGDVVGHAAQHDPEQQADAVGRAEDQAGEAAHDPDVAEGQERRGHAGGGPGLADTGQVPQQRERGDEGERQPAKADSPPW